MRGAKRCRGSVADVATISASLASISLYRCQALEVGAEIESALAYVVMSGHQKHGNKTSVLFLASILATYVRLLHDESVVDSAQAVAWLAAANIPSELLAKPFGGI